MAKRITMMFDGVPGGPNPFVKDFVVEDECSLSEAIRRAEKEEGRRVIVCSIGKHIEED